VGYGGTPSALAIALSPIAYPLAVGYGGTPSALAIALSPIA